MAVEFGGANGELDGKKAALEQQYIQLLESRVSQLQKLVAASPETKQHASPSSANGTKDGNGTNNAAVSTSATPLTKQNLDKVTDDTAKLAQTQTVPAITSGEGGVRQVVSRYNEKSGLREETSIDEAKVKDNTKTSCYLRNVMDSSVKGKIVYGEVDLGPSDLLELMKAVLPDDSIIQNFTGPRVSIFSPFVALVHNWDNLNKALDERPDDLAETRQARIDLRKVLDYVQKFQSKTKYEDLESYFKNRDSYVNSGVITYDYIWTLFPPGTEVVASTFLDEQHILIVNNEPYPDEEDKKAYLWCWYHDHNGKEWVPVEICFKIEKFPGTKPVDSLPCCPLRYYKQGDKSFNQENFKQNLINRGKQFEGLCTKKQGAEQMFNYNASLISVEKPFRSQFASSDTDDTNTYQSDVRRLSYKKAIANGKVIVDPSAFLEHGQSFISIPSVAGCYVLAEIPRAKRKVAPVAAADGIAARSLLTHLIAPKALYDLVLGEEECDFKVVKEKKYDLPDKYLTAPPRVLGWSTQRKSWCQFFIGKIEKAILANKNVFDDELQLDEDMKMMIKALVKHHNNDNDAQGPQNPDLIEGKGRGLVILLHGPPGVGKTLTAEAISEESGRPLLIVSVAEIGLNASKAEQNLERMFQLASRWEAVLLVDEADVFLESRMREANQERNALVSVLLRVLEYYQGIMILTTNRIKSLDVAVASRIHLAVRYDDLSRSQMNNIFSTILDKFKPKESDKELILDYFKTYAKDNKLKLNGRQIRNLVLSARAVALSKGKKSVTQPEIKQVLMITRDFQDQLKGLMERERANREVSADGD